MGGLAALLAVWAFAGLDGTADWIAALDPRLLWPGGIAVFVLASFLGVPQFALIAAAVLAAGPLEGAVLSWVATLIAALIHYTLGRALGGARLRHGLERRGLTRTRAWMDRLARNGLWMSALVRVVPTGPALFVNMAAGAAGVRLRDFALGTALGIVPKIAAIALFGQGLGAWLLQGRAGVAAAFVLAAAVVAGTVWGLRWRWRKSQANPISPPLAASSAASPVLPASQPQQGLDSAGQP